MTEIKRDPALDALANDFEHDDFDLVPATVESAPQRTRCTWAARRTSWCIAAARRAVAQSPRRTTHIVCTAER